MSRDRAIRKIEIPAKAGIQYAAPVAVSARPPGALGVAPEALATRCLGPNRLSASTQPAVRPVGPGLRRGDTGCVALAFQDTAGRICEDLAILTLVIPAKAGIQYAAATTVSARPPGTLSVTPEALATRCPGPNRLSASTQPAVRPIGPGLCRGDTGCVALAMQYTAVVVIPAKAGIQYSAVAAVFTGSPLSRGFRGHKRIRRGRSDARQAQTRGAHP
jgi:hypothetical protein